MPCASAGSSASGSMPRAPHAARIGSSEGVKAVAATSRASRVREGSRPMRPSNARCRLSPGGSGSSSAITPPRCSGVSSAGSSISARGLPAAASTRDSATSEGSAGSTSLSRSRAASRSSPGSGSRSIPGRSNACGSPVRAAASMTIGLSSRRRAANPRHSADAGSSQWASSTISSSGRSRAAFDSSPRNPAQAAKRSPWVGGPSASAPSIAADWGSGRSEMPSSRRSPNSASAENGRLDSASRPDVRSCRMPVASLATASSSAVLPAPASPCTSIAPPLPSPAPASSASIRLTSASLPCSTPGRDYATTALRVAALELGRCPVPYRARRSTFGGIRKR